MGRRRVPMPAEVSMDTDAVVAIMVVVVEMRVQ